MEDTTCKVCATYEIFESLQTLEYNKEEAFQLSVVHLLNSVIEKALEKGFKDGYENGYENGYKEAVNDVNEIIGALTRTINEA